MSDFTATARAYSNIAFIKYWGDRDDSLRLPANGSISMNLAGLQTVTTVSFSAEIPEDELILDGAPQTGVSLARVSRHLDHIRRLADTEFHAQVISTNKFPTGTGMASSASGFAALTTAACAALRLNLGESALSSLARLGSGSASRSIPGGFVEWHAGSDHHSSFAETIAPPSHWDIVDLIAIVSTVHKSVGSTEGHASALTSPLQAARVVDSPRRLDVCRAALLNRNFEAFAAVVEHDALLMHAVMMTSQPPLLYWLPATLRLIESIRDWRAEGTPVCFTIDAGPNVHVLTTPSHVNVIENRLQNFQDVIGVRVSWPGGPAEVIGDHSNSIGD